MSGRTRSENGMDWIHVEERAQNKIGHVGKWRFVYRSLAGRLGVWKVIH